MGLDVEELIARDVTSVVNPSEIPDILEAITQRIVANAAIEAVGAEVVGDAEIAGAIAGIGAGIGLFPIILITLGLVITLGFLENTIATMASRIPWVGGSLARFIHLSFDPVHNLETWCTDRVGSLVHNLWDDLTHTIGYFAGRHAARVVTIEQVGAPVDLSSLRAQISANTVHINRLQEQVTQLNTYVHNSPVPTLPQGVLTLPEQLYKVQQDVQTLYSNQSQFYTELQHVVSNLTRLDRDIQQLEKALIGTRTEQLGVQDILKSMRDTIDATNALETQLNGRVGENTRSIAVLNPLSILLEPGIPGLNNLRKLEDDPCQCPKLGNIPNELGTALALLEFVENG